MLYNINYTKQHLNLRQGFHYLQLNEKQEKQIKFPGSTDITGPYMLSMDSTPTYHHQTAQEISRIPRRQSHKLVGNYLTGPPKQNEDPTS